MSKLRAAGDNLAAKCRLEMAASTFLIANAVLGGHFGPLRRPRLFAPPANNAGRFPGHAHPPEPGVSKI